MKSMLAAIFSPFSKHRAKANDGEALSSVPADLPPSYDPPLKWQPPAAEMDLKVAEIKGHVDVCNDRVIWGWAYYPEHMDSTVSVEFYFDGELSGSRLANRHRQGLVGHGRYDYLFEVPPGKFNSTTEIEVRASTGQLIKTIKTS